MEEIHKSKVKLTERQLRAVKLWIEDGFKSKASALRKAGYSEAVCRHPDRVFNSVAVQKYLMKEGIREGLVFEPLKVEGNGPIYTVEPDKDVEEGYKLVSKREKDVVGEEIQERTSEIPNKTLLETAKYSSPNDPFEAGDSKSGSFGDTLSDDEYDSYSSM